MTNPTGSFCKTENCPTSESLLSFQLEGREPDAETADHLRDCEFCAAEVEFYRSYPVGDEKIHIADIPEPLRELAEALLHGKRDPDPLYKLASQ